ncbi:CAAX amino terminal protease self- immunity [Anaerohalosphaera lusitana]|uniref:CAAX amino terminal protease self-immunity n=1 Tax=Anaerohalosphaera lusitana TaxID=1936003 RepID=A0A1U9NNN5_9BACT|nr:CPBP family intramembrane glutamic endopeptidase [Anaerohalosphaera lusitana]AQT69562.1 CAAX amino terminal protease self- immunity [Anaerohalosphaera lusitana]
MLKFWQFLAAVDQPQPSWLGALELLILITGCGLLIRWAQNGFGARALAHKPSRRHSMTPWLPFGILILWFGLLVVAGSAITAFFDTADETVKLMALYISTGCVDILLTLTILVLGHFYFTRGLAGFGLSLCTVTKDALWGLIHYLAVMPLVVGTIYLIQFIGEAISGDGFQLPMHESLKAIMDNPSLPVVVAIAVSVIVIIPIFEELLFRGLLQSSLVSYMGNWPGIAATSLIFAVLHANWTHWLPLFLLSCGFGYAYEKSGSLWRPIFMHMIFNGTNVAMLVFQPNLVN